MSISICYFCLFTAYFIGIKIVKKYKNTKSLKILVISNNTALKFSTQYYIDFMLIYSPNRLNILNNWKNTYLIYFLG
jgi:hypothetical protein